MIVSPGQNDHWPRVLEHMGDQSFGQTAVEKHEGAASLEDTKVRGDNLPVVLFHSHGHDLIRPREEG